MVLRVIGTTSLLLKVISNVTVPLLLKTASLAVAVNVNSSPIPRILLLLSATTVLITGAASVVLTPTSKVFSSDARFPVSVANTSTM